jgi:hypothetical protein
MTRVRTVSRLLFAAGLIVVFAASTRAQRGPDRRYGVAVVRADGILIPFAEFDRGNWRSVWSGTERGGYALPITVKDIEKDWWRHIDPASEWLLWRQPAVSEVLTVTGLRTVRTPCGAEAGLTTTYEAGGVMAPADVAPFPKAGLATTAAVDFVPIANLPRASAEFVQVRERIDEAFDDLEAEQLYRMQWAHPVRARDRREGEVAIKTVLHTPGSRFYYVEATRGYPDPDPPADAPPCGLVTYVAGFLWRNNRGGLTPVAMNTLVSYCHLEEARYFWPLGSFREAGKSYWAVQSAGWSGEGYAVLHLDDATGEVNTALWHNAGQCAMR